MQYLDDTGTTVSLLAERAQMTKQSMAELVGYLEAHGYVTRVPDLTDKRTKLVLPTERGQDVIDIAQQFAPELEARITRVLGTERVRRYARIWTPSGARSLSNVGHGEQV